MLNAAVSVASSIVPTIRSSVPHSSISIVPGELAIVRGEDAGPEGTRLPMFLIGSNRDMADLPRALAHADTQADGEAGRRPSPQSGP